MKQALLDYVKRNRRYEMRAYMEKMRAFKSLVANLDRFPDFEFDTNNIGGFYGSGRSMGQFYIREQRSIKRIAEVRSAFRAKGWIEQEIIDSSADDGSIDYWFSLKVDGVSEAAICWTFTMYRTPKEGAYCVIVKIGEKAIIKPVYEVVCSESLAIGVQVGSAPASIVEEDHG